MNSSRWLVVVAVELGLLLLALPVGAIYAVSEVRRLEAAIVGPLRDVKADTSSLTGTVTGLAGTVARGVEKGAGSLAPDMEAHLRKSKAASERLKARRDALTTVPANPLAKLDRLASLTILLADEMLFLVDSEAEVNGLLGDYLREVAPGKKATKSTGSNR